MYQCTCKRVIWKHAASISLSYMYRKSHWGDWPKDLGTAALLEYMQDLSFTLRQLVLRSVLIHIVRTVYMIGMYTTMYEMDVQPIKNAPYSSCQQDFSSPREVTHVCDRQIYDTDAF